ncbi:MAG TPA: response regulator [Chitinophagaceae bacterium]
MNSILLIDDDADEASLFGEALKRVAPSVSFRYINEGDAALKELLNDTDPLPDIIFLDINMPKINGWNCLSRFREAEHLKPVPVVMYSTSTQPREIKKAKDLGATGFITKPDDFSRLKEILSLVLNAEAGQLAGMLEDIREGT